jgi:hypothetical protein
MMPKRAPPRPTKGGIGTPLIDRVVSSDCGGKVHFDFEPGMRGQISAARRSR